SFETFMNKEKMKVMENPSGPTEISLFKGDFFVLYLYGRLIKKLPEPRGCIYKIFSTIFCT
ncbi:hypothetical protein, partial [Chryseobacterium sp. EO14]|uniref:hypothetical protein n=1 Tax=Chryseobacterium sp. EO14 TaxID=2950551 RepID=UPI00210DCD5D